MYTKNNTILITTALTVGLIFGISAYLITGTEKIFMCISSAWWLFVGVAVAIFGN